MLFGSEYSKSTSLNGITSQTVCSFVFTYMLMTSKYGSLKPYPSDLELASLLNDLMPALENSGAYTKASSPIPAQTRESKFYPL